MGKRRDRSEAPWTIFDDRGVATLNTRVGGQRRRISLGLPFPDGRSARDVRSVEAAAAKAYAELVAGRVLEVGPQARVLTPETLHELSATWLVEAKKIWRGYKGRITHMRTIADWTESAPRFALDKRTPLERLVDDAGPTQYAVDRLSQVLKISVKSELTTLYAFLAWAKREQKIASIPPRPVLPRAAQGVRVGAQRAEPVDITEEEALAMCAVMPEWTAKGGKHVGRGKDDKNAMRVRDVFRLCWELALRPGIAQKVSVPTHYVRGQDYLWITREIDKIGLERRIPLTAVAREILERCAPDEGPIFGVHELRYQIKRAARIVLPEEKAKHFARYDFRHGRAVHVYETTGDLVGLQRLLGQLKATTTNRYVRTREAHVRRVIDAMNEAAAESVRTRSGSDPVPVTGQDASGAKAPTNLGTAKKNPRENHFSRGPSSLHLPRTESAAFSGDPADVVREGGVTNRDESVTEGSLRSGTGQEGVPEILSTAQRLAAFNAVVWDAFDVFSLHAMGVELEDVDGDEGGSR